MIRGTSLDLEHHLSATELTRIGDSYTRPAGVPAMCSIIQKRNIPCPLPEVACSMHQDQLRPIVYFRRQGTELCWRQAGSRYSQVLRSSCCKLWLCATANTCFCQIACKHLTQPTKAREAKPKASSVERRFFHKCPTCGEAPLQLTRRRWTVAKKKAEKRKYLRVSYQSSKEL